MPDAEEDDWSEMRLRKQRVEMERRVSETERDKQTDKFYL